MAGSDMVWCGVVTIGMPMLRVRKVMNTIGDPYSLPLAGEGNPRGPEAIGVPLTPTLIIAHMSIYGNNH